MLQSLKNKMTVSILDKLKGRGMPTKIGSPVPSSEGQEDFDTEMDYVEEDALGSSLSAPTGLVEKKRKKRLPSVDVEV